MIGRSAKKMMQVINAMPGVLAIIMLPQRRTQVESI
jgi:hypothetical protein